ncbi:MAG: Na/Pi symporter [Chthoniobacterales bacterium]
MTEIAALLLAGLSLFFTGVAGVKSRLQQINGRRLRRLLAKVTDRPPLASLVGILIGAITQSAAAVAFILSGMVATGMVSMRRALPVVAASNVGTALLVFLAAVDLRLGVLYLIGLSGLAVNFRIAFRFEAVFGVLFSIGLLFFGLDLMKQAFKPLPSYPEFQAFAAFLKSWDFAPILLGVACRMFIQSSSAIGVIAITLEKGGIFTETQAMLLVCGAGPGAALAVMFLSGNLKGAPRQILIYQGFINLVSGVLLAGLILVDFEAQFGIVQRLVVLVSPSQCIALVFLALMFGCLVVGLAILPWSERLLNRLAPPAPGEDVSRPAFIHDEALEVPGTAVDLAASEQLRLLEYTIHLLDCIRSERSATQIDDPVALHAGMRLLQGELRAFLGELVNRQLDPEISRAVLALERREEHLESLEDSVNNFVAARRSTAFSGRAAELMERIAESMSLMLLTARDAWSGADALDLAHLLKLTEDRGDLMERIRKGCQSEQIALEQQSALFYATTLFERAVWLLRQLGLSLQAGRLN